MEKVELRRKRIINLVYLAFVLGLSYLFLKYCLGLLFPFILAFFVAIVVQKPSNRLAEKTKIKNRVWSIILTLLLYAFVAFIISLIGMKCVNEVKNFVDFIRNKISDFPTLIDNVKAWVLEIATKLPDSLEKKFVASATEWFDKIHDKSITEVASLIMNKTSGGGSEKFSLSTITTPLGGVISTFRHIPSVFVAIIIAIVSSCFMASDYDSIVSFIKRQMKQENREKLSRSKQIVFYSMKNIVRSYATIILITGIEIFIGLNVLTLFRIYDGGNIIMISIIIALLDILPVIGTGTFMVPWAVYSLITDKIGLGIGLFVIYAIIYVVRQIIEPKIVGGTVGLPSFATLMAMYIGTQLFGFIGLFLLPLIVIIIKMLNDEGILHLWKPSEKDKADADAILEQKSNKIDYKNMFKRKKKSK